jgi:rubrerythrin
MHESTHVDVSHLAPFDTDGALAEAADRLNRRSLFRGGGLLLGGAALLGVMPGSAWAQDVSQGDIDILNYALTLEYLEAAFYREALEEAGLDTRHRRFAETAGAHEDAHVDALKETLGDKAVKEPSFDFQGTTSSQETFTPTAILLEDTGVKAYQGQAANIKAEAVLKAAISIHPVEARHAAWIRSIAGQSPAPDAFNPAADMATILAAVKGTMFISGNGQAAPGGAVSGQPAVAG